MVGLIAVVGGIDEKAPAHGGDLAAAVARYGIPPSDWLDLSTGINPVAYPTPTINPELFQHLPGNTLLLREAARRYCAAETLPVMAAGSQAIIQWLPIVRMRDSGHSRVAVPAIGFSEHAFRWRWAGHEVLTYDPLQPDAIDCLLERESVDVLVVINPHNPLATLIEPEKLLKWREQLAAHNGWLVVDEAFVDVTPQYSVAHYAELPGLVVLRSFGKYFGLAGIRVGYAFCAEKLSAQLTTAIGPWSVSGPARQIAEAALRDNKWQANMRAELIRLGKANNELLRQSRWSASAMWFGGALFNSVSLPPAVAKTIADQFAQTGILLRRIDSDSNLSILRFGLVDPDRSEQWNRLCESVRSSALIV